LEVPIFPSCLSVSSSLSDSPSQVLCETAICRLAGQWLVLENIKEGSMMRKLETYLMLPKKERWILLQKESFRN
jgi:hypothetical protein